MSSRLKASNISSLTSKGKKKNLEQSLEEEVMAKQIHNIEAERLKKTFHRICGNSSSSGTTGDKNDFRPEKQDATNRSALRDKFDKKDVIRILTELNFPYSKPEVDQWIWEVDEDLDGCVNEYQFTLMYKRCIFDETGLQPRNLFNLVQFLMYDLTCRGRITVEDTLELIHVRHEKELQPYIEQIFGKEQKTADGQQRQVLFEQYLSQMRITDLKRRKALETKRKTVEIRKKQSEENDKK